MQLRFCLERYISATHKGKARPETSFRIVTPPVSSKAGILEPEVQGGRLQSSFGFFVKKITPTCQSSNLMPKALVQGMYGQVSNTAGSNHLNTHAVCSEN